MIAYSVPGHTGRQFKSQRSTDLNVVADACIAMAYPPVEQLFPLGALTGLDLPEVVPVPVGFYRNIIHMYFDTRHGNCSSPRIYK